MEETHMDIIIQKKLPRVGQAVRSKKYGTLWQVRKGVLPGIGKMLGYAYTLHDNIFEANWELISEKEE
jgi:hypothetical protein